MLDREDQGRDGEAAPAADNLTFTVYVIRCWACGHEVEVSSAEALSKEELGSLEDDVGWSHWW